MPATLANAERIAGLPLWLALAGAAAAAATFSHALLVSLRRNRRELAVCRVLGSTRTQVHVAAATQAIALAVAAAALGVVLGAVGARWGWRALADSFGLASGSVVPLAVMAAAAVAAILVGNLAAAIPAELAARRRPSHVLRAE